MYNPAAVIDNDIHKLQVDFDIKGISKFRPEDQTM